MTIQVSSLEYPDSSLVKMLAYDDEDGSLYVALNQSVYQYQNVLRSVYDDFVASPSAGHYYGVAVRGKYPSEYIGDFDDVEVAVRPLVALPEQEVSPARALTDPGLDKAWFNLSYTITQHHTDTVIARNLEDAIRVLKEDLESEGVEGFVITSATPAK